MAVKGIRIDGMKMAEARLQAGWPTLQAFADSFRVNSKGSTSPSYAALCKAERGETISPITGILIAEKLGKQLPDIMEKTDEESLITSDSDRVIGAVWAADAAITERLARDGPWGTAEGLGVLGLLLVRFGMGMAAHMEGDRTGEFDSDQAIAVSIIETACALAKGWVPSDDS